VGSEHQEDHKNGQATGQEEQSPARYSTTMVMEITINILNHALPKSRQNGQYRHHHKMVNRRA